MGEGEVDGGRATWLCVWPACCPMRHFKRECMLDMWCQNLAWL